MPTPKPCQIELNEVEQEALRKMVNRHTVGQQIALRGRIVLAAASGKSNSQIGRERSVCGGNVGCCYSRYR